MALFRFVLMSGVFRGFSACGGLDACLVEKIAHFQIENELVLFFGKNHFLMGTN
jgi:hypothetical protein